MQDCFKFTGEVSWKIFDRETGVVCREGNSKNIVVDAGKFALCAGMIGGSPLVLDTIKVGDVDTTFTAASTDLGNTVGSAPCILSRTDNVITAEANFLFSSAYTLEEVGIFDGSTAWAFSNSISETVDTTQGVQIIWNITLN